jgi:hypothetical protein
LAVDLGAPKSYGGSSVHLVEGLHTWRETLPQDIQSQKSSQTQGTLWETVFLLPMGHQYHGGFWADQVPEHGSQSEADDADVVIMFVRYHTGHHGH